MTRSTSTFKRVLKAALTIVFVGAVVLGIFSMIGCFMQKGQPQCKSWRVTERIEYLKETGKPNIKQAAVKYRIRCNQATKIIHSPKRLPVGSRVSLDWGISSNHNRGEP